MNVTFVMNVILVIYVMNVILVIPVFHFSSTTGILSLSL